jgi:hypothetical protein
MAGNKVADIRVYLDTESGTPYEYTTWADLLTELASSYIEIPLVEANSGYTIEGAELTRTAKRQHIKSSPYEVMIEIGDLMYDEGYYDLIQNTYCAAPARVVFVDYSHLRAAFVYGVTLYCDPVMQAQELGKFRIHGIMPLNSLIDDFDRFVEIDFDTEFGIGIGYSERAALITKGQTLANPVTLWTNAGYAPAIEGGSSAEPALTTDIFGSGAYDGVTFNGSKYMTFNDVRQFNGLKDEFTMIAFIRRSMLATGLQNRPIFSIESTEADNLIQLSAYDVAAGNPYFQISVDDGTNSKTVQKSVTVAGVTKYFVSAIFKGSAATSSRLRLFVDGVEDSDTNDCDVTSFKGKTTAAALIGLDSLNTKYFIGDVFSVMFIKKALDATTLAAIESEIYNYF